MPTRRDFLVSSAALSAALLADPRRAWAALSDSGLAKFEPATGCYIGAFIERDLAVRGNISAFEELAKKKHASYFTYVGYGRPFPEPWVRKVKSEGGAPQIAFEPNNGLGEVVDSQYLRFWARDAARAKVPIFLRWASEMNGPWTWGRYGTNQVLASENYKKKFALVSRIMKQEAPNVAMVWTPFAEPTKYIEEFYPGDEWVDWVGVNIYSVYVNDGNPNRIAANRDPVDFLRFVYEHYADRKPIHISEYAATVFCKGTGKQTVDWAMEKSRRFYTALRDEFPRVKSVNWFSLDAVKAGLANNNYSLMSDGRMLASYRNLVADKHFLSRVYFNPNEWNGPIRVGTTQGPSGVALRPESNDDILLTSAAIAATITEPFLRGLKNGDVITGDLELWAQLPLGLNTGGVIWQVDGQPIAIKNTQPYRVTVPRERLVEGEHSARVIAIGRDGRESKSAEITFTIK